MTNLEDRRKEANKDNQAERDPLLKILQNQNQQECPRKLNRV